MRVIQLTAENVKKLKLVEIKPNEHGLTLVTGRNGSGKSSVLDAIWYALAGQKAIPDRPIREGCERARIRLDLGELIVERRFTENETTVKVSNADGASYGSPQAILDALVGEFSFDPLAFSRMKPREQFDALRASAQVDYDFEAAVDLDRGDYEVRTDINREIKTLEGQLKGLHVPHDAPTEARDIGKMMAELQSLATHNQGIDRRLDYRKSLLADRRRLEDQIARIQTDIDAIDAKLGKGNEIPPKVDTKEIEAAIAGAQQHNEAFQARKRQQDLQAAIEKGKQESEALTAKMENRQLERLAVLNKAELPAGLTFGNGEILLAGMPFEQASSAEQLRASCAVAMAANPKLRVLRIKDGSLLDGDSLKILEEMTAAADYQVWCERVDTTGKVGIYLEDGEVVTADGEVITPTIAQDEPAAPKRRKKPIGKQAPAESAVEPGEGSP